MNADYMISELQDARKYFDRTISIFDDEDADFAPKPEMYTVAQQIYHVGQTLHWAVEGVFGEGWDMDFDKHNAEVREVGSMAEARAALARAFENAEVVITSQSQEQLDTVLPDDDIVLPGKKRWEMINIAIDHTAHHRGILTVYTRLLGKTPPMPYM